MPTPCRSVGRLVVLASVQTFWAAAPGAIPAAAQSAAVENPPLAGTEASHLADRGTGVATSLFGTFVRKGELIVYPFFEYYRDADFEYKPEELGATGETDYRGRYRAHEALFFLAYGLTGDLAIELETAVISATLDKAPADASALPPRIEESGLGDVEAQVRWRWRRESAHSPEYFSFGEVVFPHHGTRLLTGTPDWEFKLGTGLTRGTRWGTWTLRGALEYSAASSSPWDLGEYAVEYLKRVSRHLRIYAGLEGTQDELSLIAEAQWHLSRHVFVRLNNGVGITSKATDWAPEIGILFTIPLARSDWNEARRARP